jgi:hypothetical protein
MILRWVIRSALKMDVLFMTLPQSLDFASTLLHQVRIRFTALFFGVTSRACSAFPAGEGGGGWGGFRVRRSMLPRPAEARLKWYGIAEPSCDLFNSEPRIPPQSTR